MLDSTSLFFLYFFALVDSLISFAIIHLGVFMKLYKLAILALCEFCEFCGFFVLVGAESNGEKLQILR